MRRLFIILLLFLSINSTGQGLGNFNGILNTENYYEKIVLIPPFPNGISNLAVDVSIGNVAFWGYLELEITGSYNYQNTPGKLTKIFSIGVNPAGYIYANESRVSDAIGYIPDNISIGEFKWDQQANRYVIPISHIVSTQNGFVLKVKAFSYGYGAYDLVNTLSLTSQYVTQALPRNFVNFGGNIGIGTPTPQNALHVFKNSADPVEATIQQAGSGTWSRASLGLNTSGVLGAITTWAPSSVRANTMWVQTVNASDLIIGTNDQERIRVSGSSGNVAIGTANPGSYKLAVEGTIGARKIKVTQTSWADDVFKPNYTLPSLTSTKAFIQKNGHLPGIPAEKNVVGKDIDIAEMQVSLLRKIEELTLHLIKKDEEMSLMKKELVMLKKHMKRQ